MLKLINRNTKECVACDDKDCNNISRCDVCIECSDSNCVHHSYCDCCGSDSCDNSPCPDCGSCQCGLTQDCSAYESDDYDYDCDYD